ncbi:hypothetical protein BLOT_015412 [Blomia tropicalis]|nr:hypothetical protein BLOT_015412 [Blomia tropicalis]
MCVFGIYKATTAAAAARSSVSSSVEKVYKIDMTRTRTQMNERKDETIAITITISPKIDPLIQFNASFCISIKNR